MYKVKLNSIIQKKYGEILIPTTLLWMGINVAYVLNSILVGRLLGTEQMAAINTILPIFQAYSIIAILIGTGGSSEMATAMGCGNKKKAYAIYSISTVALILFSFIGFLLQIIFFDELVHFVTNGSTVAPLAEEYYGYMLWCTVVYILSIGITYLVRVDGKAKLSLWVIILSNSVILVSDFVMIKFFGMGVEAPGIAMITGYLSGLLLVAKDIVKQIKRIGIIISVGIKKAGTLLWEISKTGWPAALVSLLVSLKIYAINILAEQITGDSSGIAIFTVCLMCWSFMSVFTLGSATTLSPIVGVLFGEQDYTRTRAVFKHAAKVLMSICGIFILAVVVFPDKVLMTFGINDPSIITLGETALRIFALSLAGTSFVVLITYYYISIGKIKLASAVQTLEVLLLIPIAYLSGHLFGFTGIWTAFLATEIITIGLLFLFIYVKDMKLPKDKRYGILRIPYSETEKITDLSIPATISDAIAASESVYNRIMEYTGNKSCANKAAVVVEEYVAGIAGSIGERENTAVDVRISNTKDKIVILFRDNDKNGQSNVLNAIADRKVSNVAEEISYIGIADNIDGGWLVKRLSDNIKTNNVLGLNNTVIIINKEGKTQDI